MSNKSEALWVEALHGPTLIEIVRQKEPASFGWVRYIGFDRPGIKAWERPDGSICGIADEETGGSE